MLCQYCHERSQPQGGKSRRRQRVKQGGESPSQGDLAVKMLALELKDSQRESPQRSGSSKGKLVKALARHW